MLLLSLLLLSSLLLSLLLLLLLLQVDAPPVSDGDYLTAWHMLVLPVVAEFRPDLILVSAGFDAVDKDPLGGSTTWLGGGLALSANWGRRGRGGAV